MMELRNVPVMQRRNVSIGSFAGIDYFSKTSRMPGLCQSNREIRGDENLHSNMVSNIVSLHQNNVVPLYHTFF